MTEEEFKDLLLMKGDNILITMKDNKTDNGKFDCLSSPVEEVKDGYGYSGFQREAHPVKVVYNKTINFRTETSSKALDDIKSIERLN